ncbi:MAG: di-trans,poly-cis-decaprenylcistransferase [Armatimonadetes bacterium]|nr:MAG: di-trans,poly-cis-decaprenylcistransferase [Armatimonadota bacterium]
MSEQHMPDGPETSRSVPEHVGIIMDGNGRWANARGLHRTQGHANGEPALFDVVHGAIDLGIKWLTVYTFSTENWSRDEYEVEFLMQFNVDLLERRRDELNELGVRVLFAGDRNDSRIPPILLDRMESAEELTADNDTMTMVFAFNYGGRVEIVDAVKKIAEEAAAGNLAPNEVTEEVIGRHLYVPDMPDPDLVIRTSGEQRTSNFLLWQAAYAEYVFTPVLWPDFDRHELARCVAEYQGRERRFGGAEDESLTGDVG